MKAPADHDVQFAKPCLEGVETVSLRSKRRFPRHAHDQFGLGVMRAGAHASWSESGQIEASQGDLIAVSPNEIHDGAPIGEGRSWEMVFVEPATVVRLVGREAAAREFGFAAKRAPALMVHLEHTLLSLRVGDAAAAEEAITALLCDALIEACPIGDRRPSLATNLVLERILDRPETPPSLDEVAGLMGMHRTGALRRFRREVGATPHDYAMQIRLRLARRALAAGRKPAEVALDLGFADQSHFSRSFVRQFGLPPGRYRSANATIVQD
ncbi:MAG: AraC family transcriptional regulator [Pseudomonadota bacterium]